LGVAEWGIPVLRIERGERGSAAQALDEEDKEEKATLPARCGGWMGGVNKLLS
jgi:hypothetical protein